MLHTGIARLRKRAADKSESDSGFTLVELAIVVLIIAILLAIAIPTFLGARQSAQNRAAQSNVRNALTAANVIYSDRGSYPIVTELVTALTAAEPSLTFVDTGSTTPRQIAVATVTTGTTLSSTNAAVSQGVALGARADSGTCWRVREIKIGASAGTQYQTNAASGTPSACAFSGTLTFVENW